MLGRVSILLSPRSLFIKVRHSARLRNSFTVGSESQRLDMMSRLIDPSRFAERDGPRLPTPGYLTCAIA